MLNYLKITATLLVSLGCSTLCVSIKAEEIVACPVTARTTTDLTNLPKLGFDSQLIAGYGEQVTYVERGSTAFRLGLEAQDVILSLNGKRLTQRGAWQAALQTAVDEGGSVILKVRDARTGAIAVRQTKLLNH